MRAFVEAFQMQQDNYVETLKII